MAIQSDISRAQHVGNNSTVTPYTVPFYFLANGDLRVVVTDAAGVDTLLTLTTDYTVSGVGVESGGSIQTTAAWNNTYKVTIYRKVAATQDINFIENGDFPAETNERGLDRLTMLAQQLGRAVVLSLRVRESDVTDNDPELPEVALLASTLLGFDEVKAPVLRTADEVKTWLSLAAPILNFPTKTWANDAERALAVPDFAGQLGVQRDTSAIYISSGLAAGNWAAFVLGSGSVTTSMLAAGILSADAPGRAKMAAGYFSADATGRGKFAAGFVEHTLLAAAAVNSQTAKTTLADADEFLIYDSAASGLKKVTRGNAKKELMPSGAVIQSVHFQRIDNFSITSVIPTDNTLPLVSEGTEIISQSFTLTYANSTALMRFQCMVSSTAAREAVVAVFRGSTCIGAAFATVSANNYGMPLQIELSDAPGTVGPHTYSVRLGTDSGTLYINSRGSGQIFTNAGGGGSSVCKLTLNIQEIRA